MPSSKPSDDELDRLRRENAFLRERLAHRSSAPSPAGEDARSDAASVAKKEFLANMGHEFRTPINGILGMVELAMSTPITPEQRQYLEIARMSAEYLLRTVDDILDFSNMESSAPLLDASPFSLKDCLRETVRGLESLAKSKGLGFAFWVSSDVPDELHGDAARLRQIVRNLLDNAIKFTSRGGVEVQVETESVGGDEVVLLFSVKDTGCGIDEDKRVEIFAPFSQADGSNSRAYGGIGLGLATASRLVAAMGGRIWLRSRLGHGSTFYFTVRLGLRKGDQSGLGKVALGTAAEIGDNVCWDGRSRSLRILLAEDDAVNRQVAMHLLSRQGHQVTLAVDGREAVDWFRRETFDLVLMDVQMPVMDGFSALAAMRRAEMGSGRRTPIAAMTASGVGTSRERCLAAGMDGYVAKPIRSRDLLELIKRLTGCPGQEREAMAPSPEQQPPFDRKDILSRLDNDLTLLGRIVDMYFEQVPEQLKELRRHIETGDAAGLERAAHKLKGSVGYFGAKGAAEAALRLEEHGRNRTLAEAGASLARLEEELDRVGQALKDLKRESAA